ncbi:hypothetical protein SAMN05518684_11382 [Salipaludibacillus aurantiacus]|uniref:Uncharacterized protein n=1 Tax=Salipaludibacillus aurantiacus TaxID=1601833 RepID=A0A1H9VZT8_9BACI|nr:hypothetical protein SAMN05518684_11382 [Salipaludibacillus aurantiacus]
MVFPFKTGNFRKELVYEPLQTFALYYRIAGYDNYFIGAIF